MVVATGTKIGRPAKSVVERPRAAELTWVDPAGFAEALALHMHRHDDSARHLSDALSLAGHRVAAKTLVGWTKGALPGPKWQDLLAAIEHRYRLQARYFRDKISAQSGRPWASGELLSRRRWAKARWHLPADFDQRSPADQKEIIDWIERTIVAGGTDYRKYLGRQSARSHGLRFPRLSVLLGMEPGEVGRPTGRRSAAPDAPAGLVAEVAAFLRWKTQVVVSGCERRRSRWNEASAQMWLTRISLFFGALTACRQGDHRDLGAPRPALTMGLLVVPATWRWYLDRQFSDRGFFTDAELDLLGWARTLTKPEGGWLRNQTHLQDRLAPVPILLSEVEIVEIKRDWGRACDTMHRFAEQLLMDVRPLSRVHRDTLEAIQPVLASDRPVAEYRKITAEVQSRMPCAVRAPRAAAEAARGYLMLRLALHLGLRQKNLREMLVCHRGEPFTPEVILHNRRCAEMRWRDDLRRWEVFAPHSAFKNERSSFFGGEPFHMQLPDLDGLYETIDAYLERDRPVLLGAASDPGTFFIKMVHRGCRDPRFDQASFLWAFRTIIERYGVYNPYTKQGAIEGLLPHGPDSVRAVLVAHMLKVTGSQCHAGYAIQTLARTSEEHYGRWLPEDRSRIPAEILNAAWL